MTTAVRITAHTPILGEEQTITTQITYDNEEDFINQVNSIMDDWAWENAEEWWDEDHWGLFAEEDYFGESYCTYDIVDEGDINE